MQNPDLGSQGLLGHPHIRMSPDMVGGGQDARRDWVGSDALGGLT